MKKNVKLLTHSEIMNGLSTCFRDLIDTDITDERMPTMINRARSAAAVVTAVHREELMEAKRNGAIITLKTTEKPSLGKMNNQNQQ